MSKNRCIENINDTSVLNKKILYIINMIIYPMEKTISKL